MALINGTISSEVLVGTTDPDIIIGLGGADTIIGGAGDDIMIGGEGDDLYRVQDAGDVVVELSGEGTDVIFSEVSYVLGNASVEVMRATGTTDIDLSFLGSTDISIVGNSGNNLLEGGDGNDSLSGRDGDDDLAGGNGLDTLLGGEGNDTLRGGLGIDSMTGGNGDDLYRVRETGDVIVEFSGGGFDSVITVVDYALALGQEIEELRAVTSASVALTGNEIDNNVVASVGDDTLLGGEGNDTLRAREGDDVLNGGTGNDLLFGGTGADLFEFNEDFGNDRIQDLDVSEDTLLFSGIDGLFSIEDLTFTSLAGGANTRVSFGDNSIILVGVGIEEAGDAIIIDGDFGELEIA